MNITLSDDARLLLASLNHPPLPVAKPGLVMVCGLPGTGKSYFSRALAERLPLALLESDAARKTLVAVPAYSARENARIFKAVHDLIGFLLDKSVCVLLDATTLQEAHRVPLYRIAEVRQAWVLVVHTVAPPSLVRQRLKDRPGDGARLDSSDADWRVYQRIRHSLEPIRRQHYEVDTSQDIGPMAERIAREVRIRMGQGS